MKNTSLFRTPYLVAGTLISAGFLGWWQMGGFSLGRGGEGSVSFLLWTGWVAVALYLAVILYVGRKYVHRVKKPPTRAQVALSQLAIDRAGARIKEVEREILSGVIKVEADIKQRVNRICREEGILKTLSPILVPGASGGPAYRVELRPTEPAGRVIVWLHAHLYFGLAAAVLVLLHGGFVMTTPMGALLNSLSLVVTVTGIIGIYYWAKGPMRLTRAERDLTFEESFALKQHFDRKLAEAFQEPVKDPDKEVDKTYDKNKAIFDEVIKLRPFARSCKRAPSSQDIKQLLAENAAEDSKLAAIQRDVAVLVAQRAKVGLELRRLRRLRNLMNGWRIVHVPASIALVGILVIHIVTVWWY